MNKRFVSGAELGRKAGVTRQAVTMARKENRVIRDEESNKYDTQNPLNILFIETAQASQESKGEIDTTIPPEAVPESLKGLYEQKLKAEVRRTEAMARKYELQVAREEEFLIPSDLATIYLAAFNSGITTNLLQIGNRIAKGDIKLRNAIEAEITKGLKRTKKDAETYLRSKSKYIIERVKEYEKEIAKKLNG